jgi:type IV pilus assembly protein PilB
MRIPDALAIELLKRSGEYSDEQISELYLKSEREKRPVQDLIVKYNLLDQEQLTRLYAEEVGLPFIKLSPETVRHSHLDTLGERLSKKYRVAVFDQQDDDVKLVAVEDPTNQELLELLKKELGGNLKIHVTTPEAMHRTLASYKTNLRFNDLLSNVNEPKATSQLDVSTPIVETIKAIVENAVRLNASDVHIEPRLNLVAIRYRIDGSLREVGKLPARFQEPIVAQVKLMARIGHSAVPGISEGKFHIEVNGNPYMVSVSTLPVIDGEKVVLHLIDESNATPSLRDLGLWGIGLKDIEQTLSQTHGLVLVTGAKASGKSTTLSSIVNLLNTPGLNVSTVEEIITKRLSGINQVEANRASGLTVLDSIKAVIGQDPNVLMIDELRGHSAAELAVQAASSGHLILASLYGKSSIGALKHLNDLGVKPYLAASSLRLIVSQTLARRLCLRCRETYRPDAVSLKRIEKEFDLSPTGVKHLHEIESVALNEGLGKTRGSEVLSTTQSSSKIIRLYRAKKNGCEYCNHTGYKGRVGLFEVLMISENIQKLIASGLSAETIEKAAIKEGLVSMKLDGLIKSLRGLTSIEEVLSRV